MEYRRLDPLRHQGLDRQCFVPGLSWIARRCLSGALATAGQAIIGRAAVDAEHRILWLDDHPVVVRLRAAIARGVVVGDIAGCDVYDPKRLYLLFRRPPAGGLPPRRTARAR